MIGPVLSTIMKANQTCTFWQLRTHKSRTSAPVQDWDTQLGTEVACWKQDAGTQVKTEYGARDIVVDSVVYTTENPGLKQGDRLKFSNPAAGIVDQVLAVEGFKDQGGLSRLFGIIVRTM